MIPGGGGAIVEVTRADLDREADGVGSYAAQRPGSAFPHQVLRVQHAAEGIRPVNALAYGLRQTRDRMHGCRPEILQ